jgi:hypothetical protein
MPVDIENFNYWGFEFQTYEFKQLAQEIIITKCPEKVFIVLNGSVIVVDNSDNRNEFIEKKGFTLKNQDSYIIRSSSDESRLLSIEKKDPQGPPLVQESKTS